MAKLTTASSDAAAPEGGIGTPTPQNGSGATDGPDGPGEAMQRLSTSAQGWHTIQMAVLGFIGICGVLRTSTTSTPSVVQILAAILAVAALAVACTAIFVVGRVAYPLNAAIERGDGIGDIDQARRQLHTGIWLTVVALILIVIAALSGWWPKT
jgi:NAD/NADP transhydrogenase beta subunit